MTSDAMATAEDTRIIAVCSGKGGVGKSTLTACLSAYWHESGQRVGVLDTDPNQTFSRWHAKGNLLSKLVLHTQADDLQIMSELEALSEKVDRILVDCAGFNSQAMVFVIGAADLVVTPVMADEASLYEAMRTRSLVQSAASLTRRAIGFCTVLSRVKRSAVLTHARSQLEILGGNPLKSALGDRSVFQEATFHGTVPSELQPRGRATEEVVALAREIEATLGLGSGITRTTMIAPAA